MKLLIQLLCLATGVHGMFGATRLKDFRGNVHHIQYHPEEMATAAVKEEYFTRALLDHFAPVSKQQHWAQRYFVNEEFWGGEGYPVFVYIGGEGPVTKSVLTSRNFIHFAAKQHRALLIAVEHRFYGKSYPTKDMSTENLVYLSSEQALSDLARMRSFLTQKFRTPTSQWIAFGGSYPGSLAAWFKLKYPQLVAGSIASSAPIQAQADFRQYMEVVGQGYRYFGGGRCYDAVKEAMTAVHDLLTRIPGGRDKINELFKPCYPMENEWDDSVFEATIMGYFQDITQYNKLHANVMTVQELCVHFTSGKNSLDQLVKFVELNRKGNCTDSKFRGEKNATIEVLQQDQFDGETSSRQWFYQTCNEFGYFQTTASEYSPFSPLKYLTMEKVATEICQRVFNLTLGPDVESTNIEYGSLGITVGQVTFPSGTIDPWHALAVQNTTHLATRSSKSVYILGTAHCADMYHPSENDSAPLQWAHAEIARSIATYLKKPIAVS